MSAIDHEWMFAATGRALRSRSHADANSLACGIGGLRAIRRFAPPRASSLPLPLSPTGSGAWTCWRGPGDHSTRRRATGIPDKGIGSAPTYGHPFANPNRQAAVRPKQSKQAQRCALLHNPRASLRCPSRKIFFSISCVHQLYSFRIGIRYSSA